MKTIQIHVYKYSELSEEARKKAHLLYLASGVDSLLAQEMRRSYRAVVKLRPNDRQGRGRSRGAAWR